MILNKWFGFYYFKYLVDYMPVIGQPGHLALSAELTCRGKPLVERPLRHLHDFKTPKKYVRRTLGLIV